MAQHTLEKDDLETTLYNINVLLFAFEEAVIGAKRPLAALGDVKKALELLRTELEGTDFPSPIEYEAPEPANSLLIGDPTQRLRKNVCNP